MLGAALAQHSSEPAQFGAVQTGGGSVAEEVEGGLFDSCRPPPAAGAGAFPGDDDDVIEDRFAAEGGVGLECAVAQRDADLMGGHSHLVGSI